MQASARAWVTRAAHEGAHGLRDMPPAVLLSLSGLLTEVVQDQGKT